MSSRDAAGVGPVTLRAPAKVTLSLRDPVKAVVLRGVGRDDYLYLLMPLRVSSVD